MATAIGCTACTRRRRRRLLERIDERYLLSAAADASVALYDVRDRPEPPRTPEVRSRCSSTAVRTPTPTGTGVERRGFCTTPALRDGRRRPPRQALGHELLKVAYEFELPAASPRWPCRKPRRSTRSWRGGRWSDVLLCDPVAGVATHQLSGHRAPAWAVCWSPRSEHQLSPAAPTTPCGCGTLARARRARSFDVHDTSEALRRRRCAARRSQRERRDDVAAAAREMAAPTAHHACVTSCGTLATAAAVPWAATTSCGCGRRRRANCWCTTPARAMWPPAVSAGGCGDRLYFPSTDALLVYDVYRGETQKQREALWRGDVLSPPPPTTESSSAGRLCQRGRRRRAASPSRRCRRRRAAAARPLPCAPAAASTPAGGAALGADGDGWSDDDGGDDDDEVEAPAEADGDAWSEDEEATAPAAGRKGAEGRGGAREGVSFSRDAVIKIRRIDSPLTSAAWRISRGGRPQRIGHIPAHGRGGFCRGYIVRCTKV